MSEDTQCPICHDRTYRNPVEGVPGFSQYACSSCGSYFLSDADRAQFLDDRAKRDESRPDDLSVLLQERAWKRKDVPHPILQFSDGDYPPLPNSVPLRAKQLLATWPEEIPERIDRSFCNLVRSFSGWAVPGQELEFKLIPGSGFACLTRNQVVRDFFIEAMDEYGWITRFNIDDHGMQAPALRITPAGWARYHELTRAQRPENQAFVAMAFAEKTRVGNMNNLWLETLEPSINEAGYRAARADIDEHNEPIMDRIVDSIRRAPFLVAELSTKNNGVYYEAGFARGLGKEVIYCIHAGYKAHFDVSAINHVRWKDPADLKVKLTNRIIGTLGVGPYKPDATGDGPEGAE